MKIFAIKNKETGLFLSNGRKMHQTSAKFSDKPRIFTTKAAASNARNCWLLGEWSNHIDYEGQPEGPLPPDKKPEDRQSLAPNLIIVESKVNWQ